jgi:lipopolysaccharide/colanic/teichoic acid biosynthesis glycosyltransferase
MIQKLGHIFSPSKYRCVVMVDEDEVQKIRSFLDGYPRFEAVYISNGFRKGGTQLSSIISAQQVHEIILGKTVGLDQAIRDVLVRCKEQGIGIITFPLFYENLTGRVPLNAIGERGWPLILFEITRDKGIYMVSKRVVDIVGAALGLVLFGLLFPFIALAIKVDSRGPIFYPQVRVGKNGKTFVMKKLRTMVADADQHEDLWSNHNDPRVTRVGRWLRKIRLDEIPQCWSILKGEMSIVGPRPERLSVVDELEKEFPFYRLRHCAKPGLAGWAMVNRGYMCSFEDAKERLEYDLYYVKHRSLGFDALIFLRAFWHLITLRGV